ncbi:TIM barrel protein [Nesterenkonia sp. K-15-9-6]|uniref:TIM barrel protein n=1 Tax=Nesterenkonia sp. K-15-9-6 TaxID=3093918 RepID=UPI00404497DD
MMRSPEERPYTLAANAEMIFRDLPVEERVRILHEAGFVVEIWDWSAKDLPALARTGARFSSMTGYLEGDLITRAGADRLVETAERSLEAAEVIDAAALNLHGTGLDGQGMPVVPRPHPTGADHLAAARTLERVATLGEEHGRVFTLENLNTAVDHPGVPFATAAEALALVQAVDSPHLRLNLDLYHAQIGEGNLIRLIEQALPWVGEVQVADVPGRCQPGTGEIRYAAVADALTDVGYGGVVAMEAFASGDPRDALKDFQATFG